MSDEKQRVISVLRALIISSPHRGKSIRDLRRDYCDLEGKKQVPIFEHRSFEDFLRASGQFIFENISGELIIYEKPIPESDHISKLVAEQNKPKRRSSSSLRIQRFIRRPQTNFVRNNYSVHSHHTKSPSKSIFPRKFGNNVSNIRQSSQVPLHKRPQTATVGFTFEQLKAKQMADSQYSQCLNNVNQFPSTQRNDMIQPIQPFDLRHRLNESRKISKTNALAPKPIACIDLTTDDSYSPNKSSHQPSPYHDDREWKEYASDDLRVDFELQNPKDVQKISAPSSAPIYTSTHVQQMPPLPASAPIYASTADIKKIPTYTNAKPGQPRMSVPVLKPSNPFFDVSQPPPKLQNSQLPSRIQDRLKNPPNYNALVMKNVSCNNDKKSTVNERLIQARLNQNSTSAVIDLTKDFSKERDFNRNETTAEESPSSQLRQTFQLKVPSYAAPILSATVANNHTNLQFQIESLYQYCFDNELEEPKFKLFKVKTTNRLQCHVTVNDVRYSTYPTDYGTEIEAKSETAKYALERLVVSDNLLKYPVCLDEEAELIIKIYKCIQDSPTGVFSKKIPEQFQTAYQESLPANWMQLVEKHAKFFTIDECINEKIVCIVEKKETGDIECQKMDKLALPWDEEYWSLVITSVTSTVEIWGRLIGKEYSQSLDALIIDIEMDLMTNKVVATEFNIGQIYLVLISECGYRVRIEKVDNSRQQCLCFFIDEGDQRWFEIKDIYICQSKFTKFPAQAIRFSLDGLEDFAENEFARPHLEEILLNKSLIGQIFTKKDEFILLDESEDMEPIIQVVFYDTSTDDDINLHPVIVEKICTEIPAPKLFPSKLTPVYISHIADNGDIFCQLQMNGLHYVNKLIRKLIEYRNEEPKALQVNRPADKKLFLVYDEDTSKWCRGSLIREGKDENTMHFIDYGKTKNVRLPEIYRLETVSQALITFPPQALKTKLYGIENIPENLIAMLRGSFSAGTLAYMKVQNVSCIPEVKLYLIKEPHIICINDSFECHQALDEMCPSTFSRQTSSSLTVSQDAKIINEQKTDEFLPNFDNLNIDSGKSISATKLPKLSKFPTPNVGSYFEIEVLMASHPGNFVIRPNKSMPQWVEQMKSLQEYCKRSPVIEANMIVVGQPYACLHSDGSWYRAIVEFHRGSKIIVYFCDLGEIDNIDDVKKLKFLPQEYRVIPKLAINAKLFGIKPTSNDWDMDDSIQFNRLTVGKKFQSIIEKIQENENAGDNSILELKLIDVSTDYDVCINDIFVENGQAIRI